MTEPAQGPAYLVLEDGAAFEGRSCGASGEATGEIAFNTSMVGYQEVMTDPSYAGQIVTMTQPHIGNYGVNAEDMESRGVFAKGMVVREMSRRVSNWRADGSLDEMLRREGIVAVEGVDTRRLTRHIRERGAMRAVLSTVETDLEALAGKARSSEGLVGRDLVREVAVEEAFTWTPEGPAPFDGRPPVGEAATGTAAAESAHAEGRRRVVAFDCGIKYNILRNLHDAGCEVVVVPPFTGADEVLRLDPDGVFLANGPGDPAAVEYVYGTVRELIGKKPVFGICLGHQMLGLAVGAGTFKLKYGHRGGNQPVKNLLSGRVEITSQNHGFCVDFGSIGPLIPEASGGLRHEPGDPGAWVADGVAPVVDSPHCGPVQLTHVNLNDMTVEGIRLLDVPAFSVQYHPEAAPGPHDARYLFGAFTALMRGETDYLSMEV